MRFIQHQKRILAKQAGMERFGFVAGAVSGEEQGRADEVDGANDDRGAGRVA